MYQRILVPVRAEGVRILAQVKATVSATGVEIDSVLHDGFKETVHERVAPMRKDGPRT